MSALETIGPEEGHAITDAEWDAWRALPATKRLAGWLQESVARCEKDMAARRADIVKALDSRPYDIALEQASYAGASSRADAFTLALLAIENARQQTTRPRAESEAA